MTAVFVGAVLLGLAGAEAWAEAPRHVVSFNICADELVVTLADPKQIAGLSPYAADPALSVVADKAKAFRRLGWQAESVLPLSPDLVLVGSWDRPVTQRMLQGLGVRVERLDLVTDIAQARAEITHVAALLGHPDRGAALLARLDAARARLDAIPRGRYSTAVVIDRGRFTAGPVSMAAALLKEAGLRLPPGAPPSIGGFLPLERLFVLRPDLVFLKDPPTRPEDQGGLYMTHPALRALYPPERRIDLPERLSGCGGPALVEGLNYLAEVMGRLASSR